MHDPSTPIPEAPPATAGRAAKWLGAVAVLLLVVAAAVVLRGRTLDPPESAATGVIAEPPLRVLVAASTTDVMEVAARRFAAETGRPVRVDAAATSTLARRLETGARADVFLAADPVWMDHLVRQGRLAPESVRPLLRNRLIIVVPARGPDLAGRIARAARLAAPAPPGASFPGRLAIADPDHVPAGRYAGASLRTLGWWDVVSPRLVVAGDVRAALRLVARREVDAGIVYATDASASDDVVVAAEVPARTHPPVRLPVAVVGDDAGAEAFVDFLSGATMRTVFERAGFRMDAAVAAPPAPGGIS